MSHDKAFTITNKSLLMDLIWFTANKLVSADNQETSVLYSRKEVITSNRVNKSMQENKKRKGFDPLGCDHRQQKDILNKIEITRADC